MPAAYLMGVTLDPGRAKSSAKISALSATSRDQASAARRFHLGIATGRTRGLPESRAQTKKQTPMPIQGAEGMSPGDIRDEINRGGRLVIYTYCISIVVMTFKRPTDIKLVRAGQNAALAGWPQEASAAAISARLREDVGQFVDGAEASDDLAILVLHWHGPSAAVGG